MTVLKQVMLPLAYARISKKNRKNKAIEALKKV
jgi:ABC-type lipoprotein export system ATPase subunit